MVANFETPRLALDEFDDVDFETHADMASAAAALSLHDHQLVFPAILDADEINDIWLRDQKASFTINRELFAKACQAIALPSSSDLQMSHILSGKADTRRYAASDNGPKRLSVWKLHLTRNGLQIFNEVQGVTLSTTIPLVRLADGVPSRGLAFIAKGWSLAKLAELISDGLVNFIYDGASRSLNIENKTSSIALSIDPIELAAFPSQLIFGNGRRLDLANFARCLRIVRPFATQPGSHQSPSSGQFTVEFQPDHVRCGTLESGIRLQTSSIPGPDLRVPVQRAATLQKILARLNSAKCRIYSDGLKVVISDERLVCSFIAAENNYPSLEKILNQDIIRAVKLPVEQFARGVLRVGVAVSRETQISISLDTDDDGTELVLARNEAEIRARTAMRVINARENDPTGLLPEPASVHFEQLYKIIRIPCDDWIVLKFSKSKNVIFEIRTENGLAQIIVATHTPHSKEAIAKSREFRGS